MPARAHQSSARLVENAAAAGLPQPSNIAVLALAIPNGATATLAYSGLAGLAFRVIDAHCVKTVGAGNAGNNAAVWTEADVAITSAMVLNADRSITRATTIDPAQDNVAAGTGLHLRAVRAGGVNDGICYVKIALV